MKRTRTNAFRLSRRSFMVCVGGLSVGAAFGPIATPVLSQGASAPFKPNAWVTIGADDRITIYYAAAEMGQGVQTGLPLILAEELDADWSKVDIAMAPPNHQLYGNPGYLGLMVTAASSSVRSYYPVLRQAGAQARRVLLENAAEHWKVPLAEVSTEPSVVVHKASGRRIRYGDIAKFAKTPDKLPAIPDSELKKPSEFRLIGKDLPRRDVPSMVNGSAIYSMDVSVPGMVYAAVLRSPAQGNKPARVDDSAALKIPGVIQVVPMPYGVGVLAKTVEASQRGKAALKVEWTTGALAESYDTERALDEFRRGAEDFNSPSVVMTSNGDARAALASAAKTVRGTFITDHVNHTPMEPLNAIAKVDDSGDGVEIWCGNQGPTTLIFAAARALGIKPDPQKIRVHNHRMGGGFGRRLEWDAEVDAILLSKASRLPVKVIWSREDDIRHGIYRPMTAQHIEAAIDADGKIVAWHNRLASDSIYERLRPDLFAQLGGKDVPVMNGTRLSYPVANTKLEFVRQRRGAALGAWRGVSEGYTKFATESIIDDLAKAAGKDPVAYRLALLQGNPRAQKVVSAAAEMARWGDRREGRGLGLSYAKFWDPFEKNKDGFTEIAEAAEVSVDRASGEIKVHRIWCAVDPGTVIQSGVVEAQVEGAIVFALGSVLRERISFAKGIVQQSNFHDYEVMRMADVPEIVVRIMPSGAPPGGIGEAAVGPLGAAIGNAIFGLTGARVRYLPMTPPRVLAALKA